MLKPKVIDVAGLRGDGGLDLMIDDTVGWEDPADHLLRLQAKLNSYLAFVESGEAQAKFPGAADRLVRIVIVADAPFPPDGKRFRAIAFKRARIDASPARFLRLESASRPDEACKVQHVEVERTPADAARRGYRPLSALSGALRR